MIGRPSDWQPGGLPGVWRRRIVSHPDQRGSFAELWRASWTEGGPLGLPDGASVEMRQANLSRSAARVLRGLHVHQRQADLWVVADGRAVIGLVDLRARVRGDGPVAALTVEAGPGDALFLPAGVAHGFYAREPLRLIYLVSSEFDGTDELGFRWDDPEAAVAWPDREPIVSERDATAPSLAALAERLAQLASAPEAR